MKGAVHSLAVNGLLATSLVKLRLMGGEQRKGKTEGYLSGLSSGLLARPRLRVSMVD